MDSKTKRKIAQVKARVIKGEVEPFLKRKKAKQKAHNERILRQMRLDISFNAYRATRDW